MEIFILLHSDAYERSNGEIIACSLFRENLTDRMNKIAIRKNEEILKFAHLHEAPQPRLFIYDEADDSWAKWNGKNRLERIFIEEFEMI